MPMYCYECECGNEVEAILPKPEDLSCGLCGRQLRQVMAPAAIIIAGNPGPKLKTRVNLDDELNRQGFKAPLFKSEEAKDKARWVLKKHSIG
jgi:hypothetical protein